MKYGLGNHIVEKIIKVFAGFPEIEQAIIYGSRAKGNYRRGSDIDLTLKGKKLNASILNRISMKLDDLLLPYTIDLSIYHHIKQQDLLDHIDRVGNMFYHRIRYQNI